MPFILIRVCEANCFKHETMAILADGLLRVELGVLSRGLNEHLRTALPHIEVCCDA